MKKISVCLFVVLLMLTSCNNGNHDAVPDKTAISAQPEQQASSKPAEQSKESADSFWDQDAANSTKEKNILSFRTGMQIILPKEWDGKTVASVGDGTSAKYPYELDKGFDTVLGTYQANGIEYALVQELPTLDLRNAELMI